MLVMPAPRLAVAEGRSPDRRLRFRRSRCPLALTSRTVARPASAYFDILERLEHAEVDSGLDLLWIPTDSIGDHLHGYGGVLRA